MGSVLSSPNKLGLGQLLSAVLLHCLSLQLRDAGVLGPEDLGGVGLLCHLGGGWLLMLTGVSLCWEREADQPLRAETQRGRAHGSEDWGEEMASLELIKLGEARK